VGEERREASGYKKLMAWRKADELAIGTYRAVDGSSFKLRWLASQMIRAAVSVPANIAEGYCRGSLRDYLRHLDIARGSLGELEYYLHFARETGLIQERVLTQLNTLHVEAGSLLYGLIRSLDVKLGEGDWSHRSLKEESPEYLYDQTNH
jgi:four helix bundle protein